LDKLQRDKPALSLKKRGGFANEARLRTSKKKRANKMSEESYL